MFAQRDATFQVASRFRKIRLKTKHFRKLLNRLIETPKISQRASQIEPGIHVIGSQSNRRLEFRNRLADSIFSREGSSQIEVRFGIIRLQPDGLGKLPIASSVR